MPGRSNEGKPGRERASAAAAEARREPGSKDREALDALYDAAYRQLLRTAKAIKNADSKSTISTSTLVHETWLRLAQSEGLAPASPLHLKRIIAQAMRQYVVEAARYRRTAKRGGGGAVMVTLDEASDFAPPDDKSLLALDAALDELASVNPRQAALIELRFFGGLEVPEAAEVLGVSESTALRDWRVAKAWLAAQIYRKK